MYFKSSPIKSLELVEVTRNLNPVFTFTIISRDVCWSSKVLFVFKHSTLESPHADIHGFLRSFLLESTPKCNMNLSQNYKP